VLWRDVSVWDWNTLQELSPAPDHVDVKLGQPVAVARRFDPVGSDAETQRWTDPQTIPVDLAGTPVVLRLTPPDAAAPRALRRSNRLRAGRAARRCRAGLRRGQARNGKHRRARRAAERRARTSWRLRCVRSGRPHK
jgi:hypothetical protein